MNPLIANTQTDAISPVGMWVGFALLVGLAVTLLLVVWRAGGLSRSAFAADSVPTKLNLRGLDVLAGLALWLIGSFMAMDLALSWLPPDPVGQAIRGVGAAMGPTRLMPERAWAMLFGVAAGHLPVALYFVFRAISETGGPRGLCVSGLIPRRPLRELGHTVAGVVCGIVWMVSAGYLIQLLMTLLGQDLPEVAHGLLVQLMAADQAQTRWAVALSAVVAAPLFEEIVFRGLLQSSIRGGLIRLVALKNANQVFDPAKARLVASTASWIAILIAGVLFGVVHGGVASLHALPMLALFGVILGWLYERTGSLWPSILVHTAYNALNIVVVLKMA